MGRNGGSPSPSGWPEWASLERWLATVAAAKPLAVVLGGGAGGLSYARSLGPRKIPILLLDRPGSFAARSRFVQSVALRGPLQHPEEWVEFLERVGSHLARGGVLFPTNDVLVSLLARHSERLERWFHFVAPSRDVVRSIIDKRTQYERAQSAGIPIPATYFPDSAQEVKQVADSVPYPCLFKPYESAPGRAAIRAASTGNLARSKALIVNNRDDLIACFDRFATVDAKFMAQEFIPGDENALFGYFGFWDNDGLERCWLTKQKLRQFPLRIGSGSFQISVDAPEVAELSRDLLRLFGYRGLVNIEFKFDARDATYRLVEINPRSASANQLAVSAGVDFPWLVYQYLTGHEDELPAGGGFRRGVKWINEDLDVQAFLALRKAGSLTFWRWTRSISGTRSWAVAAPRDPLPFLFQVMSHTRVHFSKRSASSP